MKKMHIVQMAYSHSATGVISLLMQWLFNPIDPTDASEYTYYFAHVLSWNLQLIVTSLLFIISPLSLTDKWCTHLIWQIHSSTAT